MKIQVGHLHGGKAQIYSKVPVVGTVSDPTLQAELGLQPSSYEGPTGVVGVLSAACREAGLPAASLWAAVPTYVPTAPSPNAAAFRF